LYYRWGGREKAIQSDAANAAETVKVKAVEAGEAVKDKVQELAK
jgi:hypothetical protein